MRYAWKSLYDDESRSRAPKTTIPVHDSSLCEHGICPYTNTLTASSFSGRAKKLIEHEVGGQVKRERKHHDQECQKPQRRYYRLRFAAKTVDPVDILARAAKEIRQRQHNHRNDCLREQSATIVG